MTFNENEHLIVHRGASEPICPFAETHYKTASQMKGGFQSSPVGVFYAVKGVQEEIKLAFLGLHSLSIKQSGRSNAILPPSIQPFGGWWCHVINNEGHNLGLVGRPSHLKIGYIEPVPLLNEISTEKWRTALELLKSPKGLALFEKTEPERQEAYYQRVYDVLKTDMGGHLPFASGWIRHC